LTTNSRRPATRTLHPRLQLQDAASSVCPRSLSQRSSTAAGTHGRAITRQKPAPPGVEHQPLEGVGQRLRPAGPGGFLELCYTPGLATEVTLQPVRRRPSLTE